MAAKLQSSILAVKFLLLFLLSATLFTVLTAKPQEKKPATNYYGRAGFFGAGDGFDIPSFGIPPGFSGGYGGGYGGPGGGYDRSGTFRTPVVCRDMGPCYKKSLVCPAKCSKSYSSHGGNFGGGGGSGGCTIDCKSKCIAYC